MGKKKEPKINSDASKKTIQKEAKQIIEDKTFGLKNKNKSKKVQEYCKQVNQQVQRKAEMAMQKDKPRIPVSEQQKAAREQERREQQMAMLRATLKQPKVPPGEDPKNYMCIWF